MTRRGNVKLAAVGSLVLMNLTVSLPSIGPWIRLTPDGLSYLDAAWSVLHRHAFPAGRMVFPPGFSLLLAPLLAINDLPLLAIRFLFAGCWLATALLTWAVFQRRYGTAVGWLAGLLTATSPAILTQTTYLLSEMVFLPVTLIGLLLAVRWESRRAVGAWEALGAGLAAGAAALVRTMGIVLAPALLVSIWRCARGSPRDRVRGLLIFGAGALLPLIAWQFRQQQYPAGYGYLTIWTHAREIENTDATGVALQAQRLMRFGPARLADIKAAVVPSRLGWRAFQGDFGRAMTWLVGGGLVVLTVVHTVRRRSAVEVYVLLTLALVSFWPWEEGPRLVLGLLPIFLAYLAQLGLSILRSIRHRPVLHHGFAAVSALLLVGHVAELVPAFARLPNHAAHARERVAEMQEFAAWMDQIVPPEASIVCVTPPDDPARLQIKGAAYLCRRTIAEYREVTPPVASITSNGADVAFVARSLIPAGMGGLRHVDGVRTENLPSAFGFVVAELTHSVPDASSAAADPGSKWGKRPAGRGGS